ncbi:MAG: cytochrome d ubiquinol oxidase subunit II [Pseudomonadota bacterium]
MLETIWFVLWGVLWAVYFMLDGFDLGLGALMPALAKSDEDKRVIYNAMGPFWDGNEVWLITAGGVTFAAFPGTYAVMFSALYSALMLLLFALILRGVAFEFRGKVDSPAWRSLWDICLWVGSFLPALLLGVAFANIFMGIQIDKDGVYQGTLFTLLNPYGLLGGIFFVVMFMVHGALWLAIKATGALEERARAMAAKLWPLLALLAVVFLVATWFYTRLWANYLGNMLLWVLPLLAVAGLFLSRVFMAQKAWGKAWGASALMIVGCVLFGVAGLYPNLLPSSLDPAWSMTITNSSSSPLTLKIMLGVALVMVPIVIIYQAWAYITFRHKVTDEDLAYEEAY